MAKSLRESIEKVTIELPVKLMQLLRSEEEAKHEAKVALVLDLVRRGTLSRAKVAEFLGLSLWNLPAFLAHYRIPWFDCAPEDLQHDQIRRRKPLT
jgi:predicted HTH domain antitoxin